MYYPIHWPTFLKPYEVDGKDLIISRNSASSFICIAGSSDLTILCSRTQSVCIRYFRSCDSIDEYGVNRAIIWHVNSRQIAVGTEKGFLLIYSVSGLSTARDERKINAPAVNLEWCSSEKELSLINAIELPSTVHCLGRLRDDVLTGLHDGTIMRVRWSGQILTKQTVVLRQIPFYYDLEQSRAGRLNDDEAYCTHIDWCSSFGGMLIRLSNGRCALLTTSNDRMVMESIEGVWAEHLRFVTCSSANTRFRVIAMGGLNGEGVIFTMDESTGALEIQNKLLISTRDYPDAERVTGGVKQLAWSPDGCALVLAWEKSGFSVWSVFGSLLFCSLGETYGNLFSTHDLACLDWGCEGYLLWTVFAEKKIEQEISDDVMKLTIVNFRFAKSPLSNNPNVTNQQHLILQADSQIYVNESIVGTKTPDNRHWHVATVPQTYLKFAWPLRYSCIDKSGMYVAVAGTCGISHYSLATRRWKLFGNETQESNMEVSGSICWWNEFICLLCFNILEHKHEIRIYPRSAKLDNAFSTILALPSEGLLMNVFRDILIVFCADAHINLYVIEQPGDKGLNVKLRKLQEISITSFIMYPRSVTSIALTSLRSEINVVKRQNLKAEEVESLLVNYAGRLLMFQRDWSSYHLAQNLESQASSGRKRKYPPFALFGPNVIASGVEVLWTCNSGEPIPDEAPCELGSSSPLLGDASAKWLTDALWLNCGSGGMRVWLPLLAQENRAPQFLSQRIMLPFLANVYTLVVTFDETLLLGAVSESRSNIPTSGCASKEHAFSNMPLTFLEKKREIYLHQIVKQLLRKNLGVHALSLSRFYVNKPYFNHSLELLLHEVLEEEASSKEPIPDPLLPRVIAFIQEFPEYLVTVAQCARKTEIALWHYLFSATGNPKDIFESCLMSGDLDTAAAYLIILQNMEASALSKKHAILLLDAALNKNKWGLVCNLIRFLRSIQTADEGEDVVTLSHLQKRSSRNSFIANSPPVSPHDAVTGERKRHESSGHKTSTQPAQQQQQIGKEASYIGPEEMQTILMQHAKRLLKTYRLFDLFSYVANTDFESHQFISWLCRERNYSACIMNYVDAITHLHQDFHWPMPLAKSEPFYVRADSPIEPLKPVEVNEKGHTLRFDDPDASSRTTDVFLEAEGLSVSSAAGIMPESDCSSIVSDIDSMNGRGNTEDASLLHYQPDLSLVCQEIANKGPEKSEVQLRYLLHVMMEASCFEWSVLIAIILRDPVALNKAFSAVMDPSLQDVRIRVKNGLNALHTWAETNCPGYASFLSAIKPNVRLEGSLSVSIPSPSAPLPSKSVSQLSSAPSKPTEMTSPSSSLETQSCEQSVDDVRGAEMTEVPAIAFKPPSRPRLHSAPSADSSSSSVSLRREKAVRLTPYLEAYDRGRAPFNFDDANEMELVHYETNGSSVDNEKSCHIS